MKLKSLFFTFFISITLIFASCSAEEIDCSKSNTNYEKFKYDETLEQCIIYKTIDKNECDNGVVEDGETYCNCPDDVDKNTPEIGCVGEVGEYLENACSEAKECVVKQNDKVVSQIKSVEFKNSDIIFKGDFDINKPFILNSYDDNEIKVNIEFFKKVSQTNNIKNIFVEELIIENSGGIKFANIIYEESVLTEGFELKEKSFALADTTKYETRESLRAKLIISYVKETINSKGEVSKSENKKETLTGSLGSIDIINPTFFEE